MQKGSQIAQAVFASNCDVQSVHTVKNSDVS